MGDRKREQQHGHDAPHLFSILLACKCSERALGRRGVTAQAGLLHPSALQTPGAHGGIPARSQESAFPWERMFLRLWGGSCPESEELGRSLHLSGTSTKISL